MNNQIELLEKLMEDIHSGSQALHDEFDSKHGIEGASTYSINQNYNAEYAKTQEALYKCLKILASAAYCIKNK